MNKQEKIEELILKMCKENGRIPTTNEIKLEYDITFDEQALRKFYKAKNFDNYIEYFRSLGYPKGEREVYLNNRYVSLKKLTIKDIKELTTQFINKFNHFPKYNEFNSTNNLPSYSKTLEILKNNNYTFDKLALDLNIHRATNNEGYDYWFNKYKTKMINGEPLTRDTRKYRLPSIQWYISNCNNIKVKTYNDWIRYELGLIPHKDINKEECIKLILLMAKNLNRPLMYEDFYNACNTQNTVNLSTIMRYWGTMNKMKEELGLEIVQEDMVSKEKSKDDLLNDMQKLIDELGRLPVSQEIDNCNYTNSCASYYKYFGGINNVFIKLGYIPNKKSISLHMTDQDIINIYKEYIDDNNIIPTNESARYVYELPSPSTVLRRFNCTWNEFISMLGYTPNICMYEQPLASDGTQCNSIGEAFIHNYLITLPIINLEKETLYRDILDNELLQQEAGQKRLDWTFKYKGQIYYVEYFGMIGMEKYNMRHDEKISLITRDNKLKNFIAIYPKDTIKLNEIFDFID